MWLVAFPGWYHAEVTQKPAFFFFFLKTFYSRTSITKHCLVSGYWLLLLVTKFLVIFEQKDVRFLKRQQPYFDNQTFGFRGTTVKMILH